MSPRGSFGLGSIANRSWVSVVDDVLAQHVERFLVPGECSSHVLACARLRAFPPAPAHVDAGPQLGRQVDVAHHLRQREPADVAVVGGEGTLLEDRVAEQVGRGRGDDQAGVGQRLPEVGDPLGPVGVAGVEVEDVVVVEIDAVGA